MLSYQSHDLHIQNIENSSLCFQNADFNQLINILAHWFNFLQCHQIKRYVVPSIYQQLFAYT